MCVFAIFCRLDKKNGNNLCGSIGYIVCVTTDWQAETALEEVFTICCMVIIHLVSKLYIIHEIIHFPFNVYENESPNLKQYIQKLCSTQMQIMN